MVGELDDEHVLVTGGGSGIGAAVARCAAADGASVTVLDRDGDAAAVAVGRLPLGSHGAVEADVTERAAVRAAVDRAVGERGRVTRLVAGAGVAEPGGLADLDERMVRRALDVNVAGAIWAAQAVVAGMRAAGDGVIVLLGSIAAEVGGGLFGGVQYASSKAALLGLGRGLSRELTPEGIRVSTVVPGPTDTPILAPMDAADRERLAGTVPMGRLARPEEVADAVCWLLGPRATFVSGAVVDVSGGMHRR